ncbi:MULTISPECIES: undecaprenyl-phosphate glucose phosphotransferase [unclassified Mesorhizobium]|jgi:Undecaprenyl-phosphate glucose phosphotransferase|uniref:undecaprenyl-phosphate glucose phosphotransferase n=1 Tax=unclassified Mesorhizobium TaxID=325217 RepID=UPI000FE35735|nr:MULTISPECIES: undecaprenyl-phosphate glucose phosphotransferase [unclassified Mesorhizobium]MDG4896137.1 undecaprenyl-phosphate glucose phosphotransferase [Mesorhizobium sp. WSM4976]RWH70461.1 MAG: undecaprenyl-phosphate glucose phosphotransferase [Mesorhizobium sp.]RWL23771.1 MAG: undecaprenyl-phosphate glucose phosphotransferase [Mesorhizobium sp.]RWL29642.1 MAG: undecaprenyl-phosphate glucose phosphotransferase [Mesorhizobium sp.]RWL30263.1 MAG: undecaprenyl-phosphate glucose phosphotran
MNEIDPARRFSMDAVRNYDAPAESEKPGGINDVARQVASQYRRDTMSPIMVSGVLRMVEFVLLFLSGLGVYFHYVGFFTYLAWQYPLAIAATSFLAVVLLDVTDCYQIAALMRPLANFGRVLLVWAGSFALMALTAFVIKASEDYSRLLFGTWFVVGFVLIFGLRLVMSSLIRRWARDGRMERRALIVGGGKAAEQLIRSVEKQPYNDIRICGIFDDRNDRRSPPIVAGYPKLGTISELIEFARIARIDMLIVSLPLTAESRVLQLLKKLWVLPVDIRLSAHSNALQFRPRAYSYIGSVPMLDIFDKPINDWDSVAKRAFDIVFSLVGIILFSPVMLVTAIAIKLDSKGPVLFKQKRHGFNNEIIEVYKFRSMFTDRSDPTAKQTVTKNDPRVTRVGRFIRKTSIDELPQFFNSLLGSLSLVGPRPHAIAAQSHNLLYNEVVDGYFARHKVKPGVTGWAQINGWRGEMDTNEKIRMRTEYDLYYIENWSMLFDLRILFLTPIRLLNTENAY